MHPLPIQELLDEHDRVRGLLEEARRLLSGLLARNAASLDAEAREFFADLDAFLAVDLEAHIAKEEEVLFPPLERGGEELLRMCEDMVVQHDEIKARRAIVQGMLAHLCEGHDDVHAAVEATRTSIARADEGDPNGLRELWNAVFRLDAMLQGHFDDEEGDLFPAAEALLSAEEFEAMVPAMAAIEARAYG